jgi:hypothetical protein
MRRLPGYRDAIVMKQGTPIRGVRALAGLVLSAAVLAAGCGGGGGNDVVARVGGYSITRGMLNRWMSNEVGEDYYLTSTHRVPAGLVSEPPNYKRCVAALKGVAPFPGKGQPRQPTALELASKCQQLHRAIKEQALDFLISAYGSTAFAASRGIRVSDQETRRSLAEIQAERFPRKGVLAQYLANRNRSYADQLFYVKVNLITQRLLAHVKPGDAQAFAKLSVEAKRVPVSCSKGYVVHGCKEFRESSASSGTPASILLQEIARWRPATSHGNTGVPVR